MDSEVILDWLGHLDSSSPPKSEVVVWPPTPRTLGYWLRLQAQAKRQQNQPCAVAKPAFDHSAIMPTNTKSSKKKVASELHNGQQQDDHKDRKDNLGKKTEHEARYQRRANLSPLISAAEGAGSTSGDSEAERQAQTRTGTDGPAEQQRLEKPVNWVTMPPNKLQTKIRNSKSAKLYRLIVSTLKKGFLPAELYDILDAELCLQGEDTSLFAKRPVKPITPSDLYDAKLLLQYAASGLLQSVQQDEKQEDEKQEDEKQEDEKQEDEKQEAEKLKLSAFIHMQSLISEFEALRTIQDRANDHRNLGLVEASWNEDIHKPMLHLATLDTPSIVAANITRANITKDYIPKTLANTVSLPAVSKIIDYAMVLDPEKDDLITIERVARFLETLDHPTFNQSNSAPLHIMPSGVFIETKATSAKLNEAKTQLGIWLASWFDRVSRFPCDDPNKLLPPPAIPLIIIQGDEWELWFAFNEDSEYKICGRIDIGTTRHLLGLYQILAVLRVLAQWMATDFRKWVDGCLKLAGV